MRIFEVPARSLLLALILTFAGFEVARYRSVSSIAQRSMSSVVIVRCIHTSGEISMAAGFVASKYGHIITAAHIINKCVDDPDKWSIFISFMGSKKQYKAALLRYDAYGDIASLQVPNIPKHIKPLAINSDFRYDVGTAIIAIGHPLFWYWSVSDGIISADRYHLDPYKRIIQVTAPSTHGNSGGPLLNRRGEVIGIVSFGSKDNNALVFAVPGEMIKAILANEL